MKPIYVYFILSVSGFATANFDFENEDNDIPQFAPRLFNAEKPTGKEKYSVAIVRAVRFHTNCTASVISERVLISGAKFFTIYKNTNLQVYFPKNKKTLRSLTFNVKKVYLHPKFVSLERYHDIALIELASDLTFNLIMPIPLLTTNDILDHQQEFQLMKVLGYGITNHNNSLTSGILKSKTISVDTYIVNLAASILVFRDVDLSYGDAGAPLIMDGKLVGVATYTDTHKEGFPGIFAGIVNHHEWIQFIIRHRIKGMF